MHLTVGFCDIKLSCFAYTMSTVKAVYRHDAVGDGQTYLFDLKEVEGSGGEVLTGVYVFLVNDVDYDFFMAADVVVFRVARKMFVRRVECWWKNGEWNNVKLKHGGMRWLKTLLGRGWVERDMVFGDDMVEALFGEAELDADPSRRWHVHLGFHLNGFKSMVRMMQRFYPGGCDAMALPSPCCYWRSGKLRMLGEDMLLKYRY